MKEKFITAIFTVVILGCIIIAAPLFVVILGTAVSLLAKAWAVSVVLFALVGAGVWVAYAGLREFMKDNIAQEVEDCLERFI